MDPVELYNQLARKPFQPVKVVMKDGRTFAIPARCFAIVGEDYLDIGTQAPGYYEGVWSSCDSVEMKDVLRVEPLLAKLAGVAS